MKEEIEITNEIKPRRRVSFFSQLFFCWVFPILRLGSRREIEISDINAFIPENDSRELEYILEKEWTKGMGKKKNGESGQISLTNALFRSYGKRFFLLGLIDVFVDCFIKIVQPFCLGLLLHNCFESGTNTTLTTGEAYLYGTAVVLSTVLQPMLCQIDAFHYNNMSIRIKAALCSMIHKKCLRLSQEALVNTSAGQLVNLMSNDVNRLDRFVLRFHAIWIAPLQAFASTAILYFFIIGAPSLVGMAVLILFVPFQILMGKIFGNLRLKTSEKTDERVRNMGEIISGIRVIKMFAWEELFEKMINLFRKNEVSVMYKTGFYRSIEESVPFCSSKLIIFFIFLVHVISGSDALSSDKVFLTVTLFENIRMSMAVQFPIAISCVAETKISIRRIETFLLLNEISPKNKLLENGDASDLKMDKNLVDCQQVTAKWPGSSKNGSGYANTLDNVSFNIGANQIVAILGPVGSGKSSLLHVLLGELAPLSGNCEVRGTLSYASQVPWLFSGGTIQQNIVCGLDFDAQRYEKVITVTSLDVDFSRYTLGDQTIVGENGINLSGGQKARINLARCLYVEADVYLLDDPLSAIDTQVGHHIFQEAIREFLDCKIRILIIHHLKYLQFSDTILIMQMGRIEAQGSYNDLIKHQSLIQMNKDNFAVKPTSREISIPQSSFLENCKQTKMKRKNSTNKVAQFSGSVPYSAYYEYFHSGGGFFCLVLFLVVSIATQVFLNASDYWLSIFTSNQERRNPADLSQSNSNNSTIFSWWGDNLDVYTGIYIYAIIISCLVALSFLRTFHFFIICIRSSKKLHTKMIKAAISAPISFFEQNSTGRVLNRFTKDLGCIDDQLPQYLLNSCFYTLFCVGVVAVVSIVNPWLILPIIFPAVTVFYLTKMYMSTSRSLKRLEATSRSPVFSHASSSLTGLVTIRAQKCEARSQKFFNELQDVNSSVSFILMSSTRWFAFWSDITCVLYVTCVTYTCVALRGILNRSKAGLVISTSLGLVANLQMCIRQFTDTENLMTSVERVIEYSKIPSEADDLEKDCHIETFFNTTWPQMGHIQFINLSLRYKETSETALKNISCVINPKEKIGIVGRTGAGKSSLIAALMRLTNIEGTVLIDGINTKTIKLNKLRSKISIIPQDPVLFSGSLRMNLDPLTQYSDETLWKALEDVKLKELIPEGLEFILRSGGSNLSVGERQLVCLARAILRKNRILVLDEATANVDQRTDEFIQLTIREKFANCTILTIAHRLNTIMDSDRIMVMDAGELMEFDKPSTLLENEQSMFSKLAGPWGSEISSDHL